MGYHCYHQKGINRDIPFWGNRVLDLGGSSYALVITLGLVDHIFGMLSNWAKSVRIGSLSSKVDNVRVFSSRFLGRVPENRSKIIVSPKYTIWLSNIAMENHHFK